MNEYNFYVKITVRERDFRSAYRYIAERLKHSRFETQSTFSEDKKIDETIVDDVIDNCMIFGVPNET